MSCNSNPVVSICCFTYNHKRFIKSAIAGFIDQITNFQVEIIIHDDASTDGTQDILREYDDKFPGKFKLILQETNQFSKGVSPFFRHVLPAVRGRYIAICDGDDYWISPNKLQSQVNLLESDLSAVMCHHNTKVLYPSGEYNLKHRLPVKSPIYFEDSLAANKFATLTVLFRSDIIKRIQPPMTMVRYVDRSLWLILLSKGYALYTDEAMSVYRHHSGGIYSGASAIEKISNRVDSFEYALLSVCDSYKNALMKQIFNLFLEKIARMIFCKNSWRDLYDAIHNARVYKYRLGISNYNAVHQFALVMARIIHSRFRFVLKYIKTSFFRKRKH